MIKLRSNSDIDSSTIRTHGKHYGFTMLFWFLPLFNMVNNVYNIKSILLYPYAYISKPQTLQDTNFIFKFGVMCRKIKFENRRYKIWPSRLTLLTARSIIVPTIWTTTYVATLAIGNTRQSYIFHTTVFWCCYRTWFVIGDSWKKDIF